jgi:hypothetical protein
MKVTIVNVGSGALKECLFVDFASRGAWAELRYPGGAGVWSFSLVHGAIESKRGEHPNWRLVEADLEALREAARAKGIKCSAKVKRVGKPIKPLHSTTQKQIELFK